MNNVIQFPNKKDVIAGWTYKNESVEMTIRWEIDEWNNNKLDSINLNIYALKVFIEALKKEKKYLKKEMKKPVRDDEDEDHPGERENE